MKQIERARRWETQKFLIPCDLDRCLYQRHTDLATVGRVELIGANWIKSAAGFKSVSCGTCEVRLRSVYVAPLQRGQALPRSTLAGACPGRDRWACHRNSRVLLLVRPTQ